MAEKLYQNALVVTTRLLGEDETSLDNVKKAAKKQLGDKFLGVFMADTLPKKMKPNTYLIMNSDRLTDKEGFPLSGSHWMALAAVGKKIYGYDSFGRDLNKIFGSDGRPVAGASPILKKVIMSEPDAEQLKWELNCGPRSLAFLVVADTWGSLVKWI